MAKYALVPGTTYRMVGNQRFVRQEIVPKLLQTSIKRLSSDDFSDGDALQALVTLGATVERALKIVWEHRTANGAWALSDLERHAKNRSKICGIREIADYLKSELDENVKEAPACKYYWESMICLSRIRDFIAHGIPLNFVVTGADNRQSAFRHTNKKMAAFSKKCGVEPMTVALDNGGWSISEPFEAFYSSKTVEYYWSCVLEFLRSLLIDFDFLQAASFTLGEFIAVLEQGLVVFDKQSTVE